jgi:hypothetical protein
MKQITDREAQRHEAQRRAPTHLFSAGAGHTLSHAAWAISCPWPCVPVFWSPFPARAGPANTPRTATKQPEAKNFPVSIAVLPLRRGMAHVARSYSLPRAYRRSRSRPQHSDRDFAIRKPSSCPSITTGEDLCAPARRQMCRIYSALPVMRVMSQMSYDRPDRAAWRAER